MSSGISRCFSWDGRSAELATKDRRLSETLDVIFGAFLDEKRDCGETDQQHEPTLVASVGEDRRTFTSVGQAVLELEDLVAWRLLEDCEHLLVHSAAVTKGRRTILVLGSSGAGKTTMTLELVKRGYRYLTDEYTVVDVARNCLHPFPRSTVVKSTDQDFPPGDSIRVETDYGLRTFHLPLDRVPLEPHPIQELCLVFPRYRPGAETCLRPLRSGETCTRLMLGAFNFKDNEAAYWEALSRIATQTVACAVEYGDVESGLEQALEFFETSKRRP